MSERSESLSDVLAALGKKSGITPGFRDGGLIRGPGTGISDSIPRDIRKGSFILPADSTRFFGAQELAKLGRRPRGLSHEDFGLTPDAVFHMGWKVLNAMRVLTHTPVAVQHLRRRRKGFEGGTEEDPLASHNVVREGNSYSGDNVAGNVTINEAPAKGTFSTVPGSTSAPTGAGGTDASSSDTGSSWHDPLASHNVVREGNSYSGYDVSGPVSIYEAPSHGTFSVVPAQHLTSAVMAGAGHSLPGGMQHSPGSSTDQGNGWSPAIPNPATQGQEFNDFMKPVRLPNGNMGHTASQVGLAAGQANVAAASGDDIGIQNPAAQSQKFNSFMTPVRLPNGRTGYTTSQLKLAESQTNS